MSQHPASDLHSLSANPQPTYDAHGTLRYTREELLDIYKDHFDPSLMDTSGLLMPNWNPAQMNGNHPRPWGKASDSPHVPQDPSVCWDSNGAVKPVSFEDMSVEERDMFAVDVNSTLKPPQQNKEGNHAPTGGAVNGRKTSVSVANAANYQTSSPSTSSRPGTRRRETTDTNPFPGMATASPTANRFAREESWIARRSTELKESISDEPEDDQAGRDAASARPQPLALPRSNTAGTSGFGGQGSLWGGPGAGAASTGGIGAFGSFALPTPGLADKRPATGGSRLAHLIPKDSAENTANPKASDAPSWRPRQRTDTDPFATDDGPSGSAILTGGHDSPPATAGPHQRSGGFDTPVKGNAGDFGMAGLSLGNQGGGNGPASPSETNPFRSPPADRGDESHGEHDGHAQAGPSADQHSNFGTFPRSFGGAAFDGSDRSQTSSVGAKGFASVNPLSGWPAGPSVGTPDRERAPFQHAFGGSIFGPLTDLPSPGLGGLGGVFGPPATSRLGRGKLESLFPLAMQQQMHGHDHQDNLSDSVPDLRQANPLGAIGGRGAIGLQRDTDSPVKSGRGGFEDLFPPSESNRSPFSTAEQSQPGLTSTAQSFPATAAGSSFPTGQPAPDPTAVRTMVMPDRMRWVYLDPQGTMQGPFSGLEMNDWYKANFFTPDLRVKRLEDPDFEPLGQLIRRIGNSREPFLVPQMGIAHGPPPTQGPFGGSVADVVPPLQSAFPSFGRTLTAQQQNDLERRKQEEQMFHARQREMAQHHHPAFGRLPPIQPGGLHHHSSAHSLQSQPSFGSMTSPIGMGPQHPLGPIAPTAGFFDSAAAITPGPAQAPIGPAADIFTPDLNFSERQMLANLQGAGALPGAFPTAPAVGAPAGDNNVRSQLPSVDQLRKDSEGFSERLQEFQELRAQFDAEEAATAAAVAVAAAAAIADEAKQEKVQHKEEVTPATEAVAVAQETTVTVPALGPAEAKIAQAQAELTLTEKVRKTQADNAKSPQQPPSDLPMPFPPPAQATPLAAPTAQRPASNLPARYDDRSGSGTPDTTSEGAPLAPPPTAPWAPQPGAEMHKGPSLKEIQEAEAKKAAKKEEAAAAARKAALEQEAAALREREKAAAAASNPALPASSTWGTGSPAPAGSPWKQPAVVKPAAATFGNNSSKKTLADIQREEEARKQKAKEAAAVSAQASGAPQVSAAGKRYADLASKTSASPGPMAAAAVAGQIGGWATVGAGGKVKVPTGPAAQSRSASASIMKPTPPPAAAKPAVKPSPATKDAKNVAMEEFKKWLNRELARGLIGVADSKFPVPRVNLEAWQT